MPLAEDEEMTPFSPSALNSPWDGSNSIHFMPIRRAMTVTVPRSTDTTLTRHQSKNQLAYLKQEAGPLQEGQSPTIS